MASGPCTQQKRRRSSNADEGMVNLDVLDCKICLDPLTVPVYQCTNGHAVCTTCRQKLKSKCPTCRLQIDGRCRPLEEIMESVKIKCKNIDYGCKDLIIYINRDEHERNCLYKQRKNRDYGCKDLIKLSGLINNVRGIPTIMTETRMIQKKKMVLLMDHFVALVVLVMVYVNVALWVTCLDASIPIQQIHAFGNQSECKCDLEVLKNTVGLEWVALAVFLLSSLVRISRFNHGDVPRRLKYVWLMACIAGVLFLTQSIVLVMKDRVALLLKLSFSSPV